MAASSSTPSFGVVLPGGWRGDLEHLEGPVARFEAMVETAREAERLGYESVWLYDHLQRGAEEPWTTFECWTSLGAIARETERVRLGQLVTCNLYRNPALLAKMASTLDVASGGRCILGLGAGWDAEEYAAYGYPEPFPDVPERLRRLDEAARVIHALWEGGRASYEGERYRVRGAHNLPAGVQEPRIPLLIGGSGERVLLRLVAEHADACNLTDSVDPAFYRRKLDALRRHCDALGRDEATIRKTATFTVHLAARESELRLRPEDAPGSAVGTPGRLVDLLGSLRETGLDGFVLYFDRPADPDAMRLFAAEVAPRVG